MRHFIALVLLVGATGCFSFDDARSRYCKVHGDEPGCRQTEPSRDAGGDGGDDGGARPCPAGEAEEGGVCTDAFSQLSPGARATCAIRVDGTLWCWGSAVLTGGGPQELIRATPVQLSGGTWTDVSLGEHHACAIDSAGALFCWGENPQGELGTKSENATEPSLVTAPGGVTWAKVEVGDAHSCALSIGGELYCWGSNARGQAGQEGELEVVESPTRVGSSNGWTDISLGAFHSCGIDRGALYCWGENSEGQVGNPRTLETHTAPTAVEGAGENVGWTAVAAGREFSCGIRSGEISCWGRGDDGQLGSGKRPSSAAPLRLSLGSTSWTHLSAGRSHACASSPEKTLCWGRADVGQLGHGSTVTYSAYEEPLGSGSFGRLGAGGDTTCGLRESGAAYCWGSGGLGQLGQGDAHTAIFAMPARVEDEAGQTVRPVRDSAGGLNQSLTATAHATCAIEDGGTRCWGRNVGGRLGGDDESRARPGVEQLPRYEKVVLGGAHGCGITFGGEVSCWGDNSFGQLGVAPDPESTTPVTVPGEFSALCAGRDHACAITALDLELKCWGSNERGQLGRASPAASVNQLLDVTFGPFDYVESVACGARHTCAIVYGSGLDGGAEETRRVTCWGDNEQGQVDGVPSSSPVTSPQDVILFASGVMEVEAGFDSTWLLEIGGEHRAGCWGDNRAGQCDLALRADGGTHAPARWPGPERNLEQVSAGAKHTCVLRGDAGMSCWGWNGELQLGGTAQGLGSSSPAGPWLDVAVGATHSCGVRTTGELECWGSGFAGELGNNDAFETTPVPITLP